MLKHHFWMQSIRRSHMRRRLIDVPLFHPTGGEQLSITDSTQPRELVSCNWYV